VSGAKAQDLDQQVTRLIERLDHHPSYKALKSQWKVITLLVGANNVCVLCTPPFTQLPGMADVDLFETHVRSTLDRLHHQVGKSFVNLVALFNVNRNIIAYTHENRLT
jgi:small subunit ribosomal protein S29e/phospholipase B1